MSARCEWYPKKFSAGDMTGEGSQRILGRPMVNPVELMVRETAQNSWDARLAQRSPVFRIDYRCLTGEQRAAVADDVLTGAPPDVDFASLLAENPRVFELVDWDTKGLGGPTRLDQQPSKRQPTDFIDFVLKMGAQRDTALGGGSYGFGKTASYVMSRCATVLIWTRCRHEGRVEDRFIASSLGAEFSVDGTAYTGRQWWGRVVEDRPEPMVGEEARELATAIFNHRFTDARTGTAIMVLAAGDPSDDAWHPDIVGAQLIEALLWNLWPKMVPDADGRAPMLFQVAVDGVQLEIPDPREHPVLSGFTVALQAVREVQSGAENTQFNTDVIEIRQLKPNQLTGHLAIHRWPSTAAVEAASGRPGTPTAAVALMRHEAELVVKYLEHLPLPGAFQWAGVFKPVEDCDDAFTDAEPPSHDDWIPTNVPDKKNKSVVTVSLRRINDSVPRPTTAGGADRAPATGTAQLATALADLAAPTDFGLNPNRPARAGAGGRPRKPGPRVWISQVIRGQKVDGWVRFDVELTSDSPAAVDVTAKVMVDGETEDLAPGLVRLRDASGREISSRVAVPGDRGTWVTIEAPVDLALDLRATAVRQ